MENVVDRGGLDLGPAAEALTSFGAERRAHWWSRLQAYRAEGAKLLLEKISLGKGYAKRRNAIQARLADIEEAMNDIQQLLANMDFIRKASHQERQQRPHSSLNISEARGCAVSATHPRLR